MTASHPAKTLAALSIAAFASGSVACSTKGKGTGGTTSATGTGTMATGTGSTSTTTGSGIMPGEAKRPIFLILMENHNWSSIKGSASAPYINNTLLTSGAHAEQYFNPPNNHPSEPNYIWLEAGDSLGVIGDGDPLLNHQSTTNHFETLIETAGLTWRSYAEGITGMDCPLVGNTATNYAPRHVAAVFFDDVTNTNDPMAVRCIQHVRPYPELATDLTNDTIADYNFITPNLCNDGHDSCPPQNDQVKQEDDWLSANVPPLLASKAYSRGGIILITWDEGENNVDGPIGMIALAKAAKPGYSNMIKYDHSSTLKSEQELLKITPLLRHASDAATTDLGDLFTTFP